VKSLAAADARVASVSSATTHRVQRGQTLSGIASRYGITVRQLQSWNGLGNKTQIRAGQRLRVRPRAATPSSNTRAAR
jgi:membrane-bound lytic murein transglycosylase D